MLEKIKEFYFKFSPSFFERYKKENVLFIFSKYIEDQYSNLAVVGKDFKMNLVNEEFKARNREISLYSFEKPSKNFEITYTDDFLLFKNISHLFSKYKKFKSKNISLVEVNSKKLEEEYIKINDECYSDNSAENPYSNLDNLGYSKTVLNYQKNENLSTTLIYIIKYQNNNVGCINLTIYGDLCYISGLAILKELRKTKVFTVLIDIIEILNSYGVKDIFCVTELNEYPDMLYKKLGFESVAIAYGYKPK